MSEKFEIFFPNNLSMDDLSNEPYNADATNDDKFYKDCVDLLKSS